MKNIKNTLVAMSLAAVMTVGATAAQAGIIVSDRATPATKQCAVKDTSFIKELSGIIIIGLTGLILSDAPDKGCDTNGIIVSDLNGIIVSD